MSNFIKWFIGGDNQYRPMLTCFDGDTTTAKILAGISLAVFFIFILIAHSWWRQEKIAPPGIATTALCIKKWIFIFAAFSGFGLTALQIAWPLYRVKIIVMIPLVYLSCRFLFSGGFKDVYSSMTVAAEDHTALKTMRETLDNMPYMAWTADKDGSVNWFNRQWYEYTGTTFEQMKGWGWQTVHDPKELPRILAKWQACVALGTPFEDTFPLRGENGRYRWFLTRVTSKKDASGNVLCWYGANTDVDHMHRGQIQSEDLLRDLTDRMNAKERRVECPKEI